MRLLVVEDEARIAELLGAALTRAGFAVDAVRGCEAARAAFAGATYDAAILDLGLPDGDGLTLLGELRSRGNQTPILVLTARDAIEDRVSGLDTGADDYLIKPFATTELVARIKALLRPPRRGPRSGVARRQRRLRYDWAGRPGGLYLAAASASRMRHSGTFD